MKIGSSDDDMYDATEPEATGRDGPQDTETDTTAVDTTTTSDTTPSQSRPYIVRRSMNDGDIKFERPNRIALFVHDAVANDETALMTTLQTELTPSVKKLDVREALYRVALTHSDEVKSELLNMGYDNDS